MATHISKNHQVIKHHGKPAFVLIPYEEYVEHYVRDDDNKFNIPHEVMGIHIMEEKSIIRAWREYKGFSQAEIAERMGITQAAYSQMEAPEAKLRKTTLKKIAAALEIYVEQID